MLGVVGKLGEKIGGRIGLIRHSRSDAAKVGLAPGTLIHVGEERTHTVEVRVAHFGPGQDLEEHTLTDLGELETYVTKPGVTWVDVTGIHDVELVATIGSAFGLHGLVLEDVVHTRQRPKAEEYDTYLYLVLKMLHWDADVEQVDVEQVSVLVGAQYVVTFQETPVDTFDLVRRRMRDPASRIRASGPDYLAYALVDSIVDNYFTVLETVGDRIEEVEDVLIAEPDESALEEIFRLKRTLVFLRRAIWPLRDAVNALTRGETKLIRDTTLPYIRDLYDHALRTVDLIETYREMVGGMLDIYMSSVSNRMNEVMKVLTIMATIFIPLTFIAGIYGMNFEYMPELGWRWAYFAVWGVMVVVAAGLLVYFRRRDWL